MQKELKVSAFCASKMAKFIINYKNNSVLFKKVKEILKTKKKFMRDKPSMYLISEKSSCIEKKMITIC